MVEQFLNLPLQLHLPSKHTSRAEVKYAMSKLPRTKSLDNDLITSEILWKNSFIILIFKAKKPPDSLSSYRLISLLPILSKVFEKILLKRILNIIEEIKILPDSQYCFHSKRYTIHQIHRIVDKI